jgi:ADP-heptose:LPS heptosyltransferase
MRSLLVVELTRLGDVITMLPALRLLAQQYASAKIHLLVNEQYASFLRAIGAPCEVHGIRAADSVLGFLRAVLFVRRLKADLALSMSPPKRNAAITLTSGAPRKVGYLTYVHSLTPYLESTPIESFGCTLPRREFYGLENIEERSLKVCKALGIYSESHAIHIHGDAIENAWRELTAREAVPRQKFVALHPFSGWQFRSWSIERFNLLAQKILLLLNHHVVFVCEKNEEYLLEPATARFAGRPDVFFFASEDLVETSAIFRNAALVVGNDSGPLHLAAALGAKVVGLFGPATPQLTAPRNAHGVFHYERVECSPCNQHRCIRPTDSCMSLISHEYVFHSVKKLLVVPSGVETPANA